MKTQLSLVAAAAVSVPATVLAHAGHGQGAGLGHHLLNVGTVLAIATGVVLTLWIMRGASTSAPGKDQPHV